MDEDAQNPYREILGSRYGDLSSHVRMCLEDPICGRGLATVWGASTRVGRWFAPRLGLPPEAVRVDLLLEMHWTPMGFQWTRSFDGFVLTTYQECRGAFLVETVGALSLWFSLDVSSGDLLYRSAAVRWRGIPLPRWLSPRVSARVWQEGPGWGVEVDVRAPMVGRLCRYKATLEFR